MKTTPILFSLLTLLSPTFCPAGSVISGSGNTASGSSAVIVGGNQNTASAVIAGVISGALNTSSAQGAIIIGGFQNTNAGFDSVINSGGANRILSGAFRSVILSGGTNELSANASNSFIGAGNANINDGERSGIVVGENNSISSTTASTGGRNSAILCGDSNAIFGEDCAIIAGIENVIGTNADYSVAAGRKARAIHDGCFVWSDANSNFTTTADGQFLINVSDGLGIGTDNPSAGVHIFEDKFGVNSSVTGHAAIIEHSQATASVLALQVGDTLPNATDNFVTFFNGAGTPQGNIEGNGSGGVVFNTSGSDFAEYLPKQADTDYAPGEIVPVAGGQILSPKAAHLATNFMVVTEQAAVAGNTPTDDEAKLAKHELVSFIGQVPVQVDGPVHSGDFIIADLSGTGVGIARRPAQLTLEESKRIVGRAWEGCPDSGQTKVNVAIGVDQISSLIPLMERLTRENRELREQMIQNTTALQRRLDALEGKLETANP